MSAPTEQQMRLARLLELPDFRQVIAEWLDSGFSPWTGPVSPDQAADASYVNGRAAFLVAMMNEIRQYFPARYAQIERERFDNGRSIDTELAE